jgi:class 3 adenylate cyclase
MTQVVENPLQAGREAVQRYAWREAYELLKAAQESTPLGSEDLESLAEAAWWIGHLDEALELRERAYTGYADDGNARAAARVALTLAEDFAAKGSLAVAQGWFGRADRLLADQDESVEHGLLALARAFNALVAGNVDEVLAQADKALSIGQRMRDRELEAYALVFRGRGLVLRGQISEGLALLDEATAAALAGELRPRATGVVYCTMITSCQGLGDYRRAGEWTAEANRWCDRQDITGFPGACRIHRAELMRLSGDWNEAEQQAVQACEEVGGYDVWTAAAGFYEIGEIRRRRGDFAAAEDAYRRAKELGRDPQPGLALLRLAQGKVEAAASAIKRSLAGGTDPIARGRRLPAQVAIAIEAGDLKSARAAADELEQIADTVKIENATPPAFAAGARLARGQVSLAEGDAEGAATAFEETARLWTEVGAPYEDAQARMFLGLALRRAGDEDSARDEIGVARAAFERLGAVLDSQRAAELLGEAPLRRTFMFTDVVDSTKLVEALGEEKWSKLLAWHDRTLRELIVERSGEVIKQTGDGYFAAFHSPGAAVEAAVAIQRALDAHEPLAPDVRIGVHTGGAFARNDDDYAGQGVHMAARIGALAGSGEILASCESLAGVPVTSSTPREVELKGFAEPVKVASIDWR